MLAKPARIACTALFLLSLNAYAEPAGFRAYQLAQHGSLQLAVPRSWNDQMQQRQPDAPPTILFSPDHGSEFSVRVTPLWPTTANAVIPGADEIRGLVSKTADEEKTQAAETTVSLQEIRGASGTGYYFSITDRVPRVGEFKYMTRGMLRVGDLIVAFTILSNDGSESAVADALKMLNSARQEIGKP